MWLIQAHRTVRPSLRRVIIWNRTVARATYLAERLGKEGIEAQTTTDLDGATREADLITACTRSHTPLIKGANFKPGVHLDLVGGYTPQTRRRTMRRRGEVGYLSTGENPHSTV